MMTDKQFDFAVTMVAVYSLITWVLIASVWWKLHYIWEALQ